MTSFGSAYLKSRSSDSFTAAVKDFVPPQAVSISNCGAIPIVKTAKHADTSGTTHPNLVAGFTVKNSAGAVVATVNVTVSFENVPLSDIGVTFSSQVPGGTAAKISCTGLTADPADATPNAFDDSAEAFKNLTPGTYNCTIVVDP